MAVATELMEQILTAGAQSFQQQMSDISANTSVAHNLARLGAVRKNNELDPAESRAISGLVATPIAPPTTNS